MSKLKSLMLLFVAVLFVGTGCTKVNPKEVVVRVYDLGKKKGTTTVFNTPGRYDLDMWTSDDFRYPTSEQNYRWTQGDDSDYGSTYDESIKLQLEGNDCWIDVGIRFNIDGFNLAGMDKLVGAYPVSLEGIVDGLLFERVRSATKLILEGKTLDNVMDNISYYYREVITDTVAQMVKPYGIEVLEVYDISGLGVPPSISERKNKTQEATQRKQEAEIANQTLIETAQANAKAQKIEAEGVAEAMRIRNANPPSKAVLEYMKIEKWDGVEAPNGTILFDPNR